MAVALRAGSLREGSYTTHRWSVTGVLRYLWLQYGRSVALPVGTVVLHYSQRLSVTGVLHHSQAQCDRGIALLAGAE